MTITTCHAAIHDPNIPISEYMRKEFFYRAFQRFSSAIGAEPSLVRDELIAQCERLDRLHGLTYQKSRYEQEQAQKFTQGDYRRFCLLFFLLTRKIVQTAEMFLLREGKKRIMPRHMVNAAIATGIIPYKLFAVEMNASKETLELIKRMKLQATASRENSQRQQYQRGINKVSNLAKAQGRQPASSLNLL